ncbi:MAG: dipeptide epimerase [Henriciella sp.]
MQLDIQLKRVEMAEPIAVSRGAYADAMVIVVELNDGRYRGRGECCPMAHYNESPNSVIDQVNAIRNEIELRHIDRTSLQSRLPAGSARNAIDCAFWDLDAKRDKTSVWELSGISNPGYQKTAMTVVLDTPEKMAANAKTFSAFETIKLKLGPDNVVDSLRAVSAARPDASLSIDVNEGWSRTKLDAYQSCIQAVDAVMVEQPLPADSDQELDQFEGVPLCADESFHTVEDLERVGRYFSYGNIKLDKCGGLTHALELLKRMPDYDLKPMVGCMFSTSLAMGPALVVAAKCEFADLDGPLHLARDRRGGFRIEQGAYNINSSEVWGWS